MAQSLRRLTRFSPDREPPIAWGSHLRYPRRLVTLHDNACNATSAGTPPPAFVSSFASALEYRVLPADPQAASELGRACGLGATAAQVLLHRGFEDPDRARSFLDPRLGELTDPAPMVDREAAAERLAHACRRNELVAVFGDYDVDGTTSAAILSDVLEALGARVRTFVANRFEGGYGFSDAALTRVLSCSPTLIVTCDCGSSDHERLAKARAAGIDVIVVDHHLVPKEPLPALAFLNPHRPDCGFAYKGMCSAGLAFNLSAAIRAKLGAKLDLRPWLDLVALGTVADVAPLDGDNRTLVRAGLRLLASPNARPGVQALRELAGIRPGRAVSAFDIAFRFAPRLNAPGRLADPTLTLQLLRAKSLVEARAFAARVEQINDERKATEQRTTMEAIEQIERLHGRNPQHGVVAAGEGWHRGVVGISAARLVDRFDVPSIVISLERERDGSLVGHGSGRTPDGFHLHRALTESQDRLKRFGGHAAAVGLTISADDVDAFREAFARVAPRPEAGTALPVVDVELSGSFELPTASDLARLEPLGEANAAPIFALPHVAVEDVRIVADGQHLKLRLRHGKRELHAFGRDMAHLADQIGKTVTVLGELRPDGWRGGEALELSIHHVA